MTGLRVLSLDGGGGRAISELFILQRILRGINPESPPKPCEIFDLIGGTSFGGIVAILLAHLRMSIDDCISTFKQFSPIIFGQPKRSTLFSYADPLRGRFDTKKFEDILKRLIQEYTPGQDEIFQTHPESATLCVVLATKDNDMQAVIISNDTLLDQHMGGPMRTWEAARATCATPGIFDPIQVGPHGIRYLDGGLGSNNPIFHVLEATKRKWPDREIQCLVSIGSGTVRAEPLRSGAFDLVRRIAAIANETENTADSFLRTYRNMAINSQYFRFRVSQGLDGLENYDTVSLEKAAAATQHYFSGADVEYSLEQCASRLKTSEALQEPTLPVPIGWVTHGRSIEHQSVTDTTYGEPPEGPLQVGSEKPDTSQPLQARPDYTVQNELRRSVANCLQDDRELEILLRSGLRRIGVQRMRVNFTILLQDFAWKLWTAKRSQNVSQFVGLNARELSDSIIDKQQPQATEDLPPPTYDESTSDSAWQNVVNTRDEIQDLSEGQFKFSIVGDEEIEAAFQNFDAAELTESNPFAWMKQDLRHLLFPTVKSYINEIIIPSLLPTNRTPIYTVSLQTDWELPRYLEEEFDSSWRLTDILTLSGEIAQAQAVTCGTYMSQTWGKNGSKMLEAVEYALREGRSYSEFSKSHSVQLLVEGGAPIPKSKDSSSPRLWAEIAGRPPDIAETIEQIAWLCCAFRFPDSFLGLSQVELFVESTSTTGIQAGLRMLPLRPWSSPQGSEANPLGTCWTSLFDDSVLAWGFPVQERPEFLGLEISYQVMLQVSGAKFPVEFQDSIVIRQGATTIFPVAAGSGGVQWHLISGDMNDFFEESRKYPLPPFDAETFLKGRTFLGWVRHALVKLGTEKPMIEASDAKLDKKRGAQIGEEVTLNLGIQIPYVGNVGGSTKVQLPRSKMQKIERDAVGYAPSLNSSRVTPSIFYDCQTQTGWLVPELSLILHLTLAHIDWMTPVQNAPWRARYAQLQADGGMAALNLIQQLEDTVIWNAREKDKPFLFSDLIMLYICLFASLKESLRLRLEHRELLATKRLRGWDFTDLRDVKYLFRMRKARKFFPEPTPDWWPLFKNPNTLVMFGTKLGQVVVPNRRREAACSAWAEIPSDQNLLVATVRCLNNLNEPFRPRLPRLHLMDDMAWHKYSNSRPFDGCVGGVGAGRCNPVQGLRDPGPWPWRRTVKDPELSQAEEDGAAVFGTRKLTKKWIEGRPVACQALAVELGLLDRLLAFALFLWSLVWSELKRMLRDL